MGTQITGANENNVNHVDEVWMDVVTSIRIENLDKWDETEGGRGLIK